jgi:hypothetical protein
LIEFPVISNLASKQANKTQKLFKPKITKGGNNQNCKIKAARELFKKKVFCISNIASDTSCVDLKEWIESFDIVVYNVFEAKTKFKNSMAFRICIREDDSAKFLETDVWAPHVIIREWVFKSMKSQLEES